MLRPWLVVAALFAAIVTLPGAAADEPQPTTARYIAGAGWPLIWPGHAGPTCAGGYSFPLTGGTITLGPLGNYSQPVIMFPDYYFGGACFDVVPGTYVVTVDGLEGAQAAFWWSITGGLGSPCPASSERAVSEATLVVPPDCDTISVTPEAGNAAGTITLRAI